MFGIGLVEILLLLFVVLVLLGVTIGVGASLVRFASRSREDTQPVAVAREWRLVTLTRLGGLAGGLAVAWTVARRGAYGTGPMLAPATFGLCVLLATALGETVVRPRRVGAVRSASLRPRRIVDYLPGASTALVASMAVLTGATLVLTTLTASQDSYTHEMRALTCATATFSSSRGRTPGASTAGRSPRCWSSCSSWPHWRPIRWYAARAAWQAPRRTTTPCAAALWTW